MIGKLRSVVVDCRDPLQLATFYQGVIGGTVTKEDDTWVVLTDDSGRRLAFQLSPHHEPPTFPDPRGSQQFHLDIAVDDVDRAEREPLPGVPRSSRPHVLPRLRSLKQPARRTLGSGTQEVWWHQASSPSAVVQRG
jgi:hypothetical protein